MYVISTEIKEKQKLTTNQTTCLYCSSHCFNILMYDSMHCVAHYCTVYKQKYSICVSGFCGSRLYLLQSCAFFNVVVDFFIAVQYSIYTVACHLSSSAINTLVYILWCITMDYNVDSSTTYTGMSQPTHVHILLDLCLELEQLCHWLYPCSL